MTRFGSPKGLASIAAATLVLVCLPWTLAAQDFTPDRALIDKLERGDVMHVHDDNGGRMDLLAVMLAASHARCESMNPGFGKIAAYVAYLGSDSGTGKYPSREFTGMGLMAAIFNNDTTRTEGQESTFDAPWMIEANGAAMLAIASQGCSNPRFQTIVRNLFKTLDHHVAWHEQKLGSRAPLMKQTVVPVRIADWRTAVEQDVELPAQPRVDQQFADLEARGATYLDCVYGPLNPDSTGTANLNFWNKEVFAPGGDFLKVSRRHPLAELGDLPLTSCPPTLADGQQKRNESRNLAMSKVDSAALAPLPAPLQLMMGPFYQNYVYVKQSWLSYQRTHNQADLQHAIDQKVILLRNYGRPCRPGGENDLTCQVSRQLNQEFAEIPDGPTSSAVPNTRVPDMSMRGDPTAQTTRSAMQPSERTGAAERSSPSRTRAPAAGGAIPPGTALIVVTSEPIALTEPNRTYRAHLAQPAQLRGEVSAPAESDVVIEVSEAREMGRSVTAVSLTVEAVVVDGRTVRVATQPVIRPISIGGRSMPNALLPANSRLVFIVAAPAQK